MENIFPKTMLAGTELNLDAIVSKLTFYQEQIHLQHWQSTSYAEHKALGSLYKYIQDFRDELIEKIMGYCGKRPGPYKLDISCSKDCKTVLIEMLGFASSLKMYGEKYGYHDVCNLADSFSGQVAKTKYLLTLN